MCMLLINKLYNQCFITVIAYNFVLAQYSDKIAAAGGGGRNIYNGN